MLYRQHYYNTYVYVTSCIKERFDIDQLDFKLYPQMRSLLSKAENGILYQEEYNTDGKDFKNDLDAFSLEGQLRILLECRRVKSFIAIHLILTQVLKFSLEKPMDSH